MIIPRTASVAEDLAAGGTTLELEARDSRRVGLELPSSVCIIKLGSSSACDAPGVPPLTFFGAAGELAGGMLEADLEAREEDWPGCPGPESVALRFEPAMLMGERNNGTKQRDIVAASLSRHVINVNGHSS